MDTSLVRVMGSRISRLPGRRATPWIVLALCAATTAAWVLGQLVGGQPAYAGDFAPGWLPLAAAALAAAVIVLRFGERLHAPRLGRASR